MCLDTKSALIYNSIVGMAISSFVCIMTTRPLALLLVHQFCPCVAYRRKNNPVIDELLCCIWSIAFLYFEFYLFWIWSVIKFQTSHFITSNKKGYLERLLSALVCREAHSINSSLEQLNYCIAYCVCSILFGWHLQALDFQGSGKTFWWCWIPSICSISIQCAFIVLEAERKLL